MATTTESWEYHRSKTDMVPSSYHFYYYYYYYY